MEPISPTSVMSEYYDNSTFDNPINFDRQMSSDSQGSLGMCGKLVDVDLRNPANMIDFMEANIDLNDYIVEGIGSGEDESIVDDDLEEIKKSLDYQNALFDDINCGAVYAPTEYGSPEPASSGSGGSDYTCAYMSIKSEIKEEENSQEIFPTPPPAPSSRSSRCSSSARSSRRPLDPETALEQFVPKTHARKYQLKKDEEKGPEYILKRNKNNDAVRKSRAKQRELQKKKDNEIQSLRDQVKGLKQELKRALVEKKKLLSDLHGCKCAKK